MKIRAAVVDEPGGPFVVGELEISGPRSDELLVEMVAVGLCHTDLLARNTDFPVPLPAVFGHEGAGIVREVGEAVEHFTAGDRVLMSFAACHQCVTCRSGAPAYCVDSFARNFGCARPDGSSPLSRAGRRVNGNFFGQSSFASAVVAHHTGVVKVGLDADLKILAPLGCGVQTGAGAVLRSLKCPAGSSIAVFGVGAVGLSAIMGAKLAGCARIVAVDVNQNRLDLALELGATDTLRSAEGLNLSALLMELTRGAGVDSALDTTGRPDVARDAVDALAPMGTFGLIGAAKVGTEVSLDMGHMMLGRSFRGIVEGDSVPQIFIPELIELHRQGRFPFDRLIAEFPFEEINEVAQLAERGEVIKPVLTFG
jgi:aryl-alcohol dehydrogenase